jgi:hypothetical protein
MYPFRRLHRSTAEHKLDLFEFSSISMAEAGATATKIVGRQIVYAGPRGIPFDNLKAKRGSTYANISHVPQV